MWDYRQGSLFVAVVVHIRTCTTADPLLIRVLPSLIASVPVESNRPFRLLFVCLGNICRSPLAEGVFLHLAREAGVEGLFETDSAGTGAWHVGEAPDTRSVEAAARRGVELRGRARGVQAADFSTFDLILGMDSDNIRNLERLRETETTRARVVLLREFDHESEGDLSVPDPYYGGPDGFDRVFDIVHRSCTALLRELRESHER